MVGRRQVSSSCWDPTQQRVTRMGWLEMTSRGGARAGAAVLGGHRSATVSIDAAGLHLLRRAHDAQRYLRGVAHSDSIVGAARSVDPVAVSGEFMSGFSVLGKDTAAVTAPTAATMAIPRKAEW
jgi:hypothetical protein